ncbi:hypothetical protein Drose_05570 [Dactylosporangium roseum]|uniref:Uncharacterized protein n=1 Tax=Dactylosporangium roseum TaxID=47989 RepID=A0ABY5Z9R6_9ACTN|nr:hypothetical protein [Dactylosporangium roseum]UWZ37738.1 hypothetical protein Drose_05570 [Dactylosporangium roseum]
MTRDAAIDAEVVRYVDAARRHDIHLAHIRLATPRSLRGLAPYDSARLADDTAGDAMFGDDHTIRAVEPVAA